MVNVLTRQLAIAALGAAVSFSAASASAEVIHNNTGTTTMVDQQSSESIEYNSSTTVTDDSSEVVKLTTKSSSVTSETTSIGGGATLTDNQTPLTAGVSAASAQAAPIIDQSAQKASNTPSPTIISQQSDLGRGVIMRDSQPFHTGFYTPTPSAKLSQVNLLDGTTSANYPPPTQSGGAAEAFGQLIGFINGISASISVPVEQLGVIQDEHLAKHPILIVIITTLFIGIMYMMFVLADYTVRLKLSGFLAAPRSDVATNQFFATPTQWVLLSRSAGS